MSITQFTEMIGQTITHIEGDTGWGNMLFTATTGTRFRFYHLQDCCENVQIEDIIGDLSDLLNSPIVEAEEISSDDSPAPECHSESYTWTFYRYATAKGTVTVRWLGESNGYYSEGVEYKVLPAEVEAGR